MPDNLNMVRLVDLTKIHRRGQSEVPALRGVSCEFPADSMTFVLGPSGSGKSTLLYLIGALDDPTNGEIHVGDRRIDQLTAKERDAYRRHEVGFVFQNFNLLSNLNAVDNTLVPYMPAGITAERREHAVALLEQVGMGDRLDHRPNQLSGGEQQRVAIARALLKRPSLILADEPTGELDSQIGAEVFGYLRRLREENQTTIIVVTHDTTFITDADRVLRLRDGRLEDD